MDHFPLIPHQHVGGGIDCPGRIIAETPDPDHQTTLRCDECGAVVGIINRWILRDLVSLTTNLDEWQPTAEWFNILPSPIRDYIHDLETRADPAGDVQDLALARMTIGALETRIRELEAQL